MSNALEWFRENRTRMIVFAVLLLLFLTAIQGMPTEDWVVTLLRGLAVGALTFIVASGLSIILGLLDVLNLAHGEVFMLGAYTGWMIYIRPDTFVDILTPILLLGTALVLMPLLRNFYHDRDIPKETLRVAGWVALVLSIVVIFFAVSRYAIAVWNYEVYTESPVTFSLFFSTGMEVIPAAAEFVANPVVVLIGIALGGVLLVAGLAGLSESRNTLAIVGARQRAWLIGGATLMLVIGLLLFVFNTSLTEWIYGLGGNWRFLLAVIFGSAMGAVLGALIETTMIRPLYDRTLYQIMLTLGLGFIIIELVRAVWGRPEFQMPRPPLFDGSGPGCPATSIGGWLQNSCATIRFMGTNIRTYNEIFLIVVGVLVMLGITLLLQRTRIGMIIRAGVQDSEMVEALGINVRQVFTLVYALGTGLAALGGVLAGPAMGLSNDLGQRVLLLALIAMAIGGLTSFPGAAVGSVVVGLIQQFVIKYGQIGITLPFMEEAFKPSPPLVPASNVLLMVIILLILPQGLLGRKE